MCAGHVIWESLAPHAHTRRRSCPHRSTPMPVCDPHRPGAPVVCCRRAHSAVEVAAPPCEPAPVDVWTAEARGCVPRCSDQLVGVVQAHTQAVVVDARLGCATRGCAPQSVPCTPPHTRRCCLETRRVSRRATDVCVNAHTCASRTRLPGLWCAHVCACVCVCVLGGGGVECACLATDMCAARRGDFTLA